MLTYSYMFLSNSVEFSVILQCTMTQYHICCMFSRLSCEFTPWEPEPEKDLLPHQASAPQMICSPLRVLNTALTDETPSREDRAMQNYCEASGTFIFSVLCHARCIVTTASLSPICPSWLSDLCMYTYTKFFSSAFTYPTIHVVLG